MKWASHVACIGKRNVVYSVVVGKPERHRPLGSPGLDKRIILKWNFRMWIEGHRICRSGSRQAEEAGN